MHLDNPLCRHCGRPAGGRGHEPRTEGDTIHMFEPRTPLESLVDRWVDAFAGDDRDALTAVEAAIMGAVREMLDKAAEAAEGHELCIGGKAAAERVRKLGEP